MAGFYIALYRFFKAHKVFFYSLIIATSLIFAFFASKLHFEENIAALLPKTEESTRSAVAFADIKVKDKLFLQITDPDGKASPQQLAGAMDEYVGLLLEKDTDGYISNILYRFDADDIMNLVYYAMDALPCHLPAEAYPYIDSLLSEDAIEAFAEGKTNLKLPQLGSYAIVGGHLLTRDSTVALAYLAPSFPSLDTKSGGRLEALISRCADEFRAANPGFDLLYHGSVVEGTYNAKQIKRDIALTVGISLLVICIFICICFRGKKTLLLLLLPVAYGTLLSMACIYWIKGGMSFIALGIGALVLGVALSYCLHVLTHYKFVGDPETVIKEQTRPVSLGCITTIGAFAGLLFTSSELLRDFGLFASFTLVGTTFFALAFLPQFFAKGEEVRNEKAFNAIGKINSYPLDRNIPVVAVLAVVCAVTLFTSGNVGFDSDLSHIGYREPKVVKSEGLYADKVNGNLFSQYFATCSGDLDSAIVMNKAVARVLDSLKNAGVIYGYSTPKAFLLCEEDQRANIALWQQYWTPEKVQKGYEVLKKVSDSRGWLDKTGMDIPETFKLMTEADYEPQSLYDSGAVPESLMSNFVEQVDGKWLVLSSVMLGARRMLDVDRVIAESANVVVLDPFYYTGDMVEIVHSDFNIVLLISSIFVFIVLLLSFRSIVISLIAFLPMALSWYIVQGMMAILGLEFNLVNIMISTFIFGIGVDYSIFVMDGLIDKEKQGDERLVICHKAAIFFSGVTLLVVIGSLLFAIHPAIHSVGSITIIGMASTILITYAFQPLLFRLAMKNRFLRKRALRQ